MINKLKIILKNILFLFLSILATETYNQDVIYLLDGNTITGKVVEVSRDFIRYNNYAIPTNTIFSMDKKKVEKIVFEDGRTEWMQTDISPNAQTGQRPTDQRNSTTGQEEKNIESADEKKLHFGVFGGITAATGIYDYKGQPNPPATSMLAAPAAGILMDWIIANKISLRASISYRGKGDRIDVGEWTSGIEQIEFGGEWETAELQADGFIRTYVGYAELAVFPVIQTSTKFRLGIGGYIAAGLHGKEKSDYVQTIYLDGDLLAENVVLSDRKIEFTSQLGNLDSETTRYFNRMDYGFIGYLGFGTRPITFGITFNYGRVPWEPDNDQSGISSRTTETYHISSLIAVNYWFN